MNISLPPSDGSSRDRTWNAVHAAALETLPHTLRLLGVAEADLDDVLQEVLLAAYQNLDRFDPTWSPPEREAGEAGGPSHREDRRMHHSPEARWVFGIAWRKVNHHLERAYRRREVPAGLHPALRHQIVDPAPISEQHVAERERLELVLAVLRTIVPERRMVLVLYEAGGMPLVEIARELGINYNTAATRLRLARQDFRAAIKRLRPEQRQALRASWLVLPLAASDFLVHEGDASTSVPPAPAAAAAPPAPAAAPVPPAPAAAHVPPASAPPASAPTASAPPAPVAPLRLSLRQRLSRLGSALGWVAAGSVGTAAALLAIEPEPPLWARRFGAVPLERSAGVAHLAAPSPQTAAPPQQAPEPRPVALAAEALHPTDNTTSRPAPPAGEPKDAFAEERRLLAAAQERLSAGDPAGALRRLVTHEARFPTGRLTFVRERLRSMAEARLTASEQGASGREPSR